MASPSQIHSKLGPVRNTVIGDNSQGQILGRKLIRFAAVGEMPVVEKLKMLIVQEPVVAASVIIAGIGLFLPAVVRPMLDSFSASKQEPKPDLNEVVAGMTGKKHG